MNTTTKKANLLNSLFLVTCLLFFLAGTSNKAKACICAPPGTVTAIAATGVTSSGFTADWNTPTTSCGAITNYQIDVSTSPTFTSSVATYPKATGSTTTDFAVTGLACGTTYYYRIKGTTCGGNSAAWSNTITVTTATCGPTCTDGIQNGTETGVDCGGTCVPCTCTNGIQDGTETGIDCGGSCNPCTSCYDGIQNGTETGVDCGGSCPLICTTNSGTVSSTCGACPTGIAATVYTTNCDQVGTSAYDLNSPLVSMEGCGSFTAPTPSPTCGTVGSYGTWIHVDLAPGTTQVQLAFETGSIGSGSSSCYAAAYQGTGCGALTAVPGGCQLAVDFISGTYGVYQNFFTGLNPSQDLWIFLYNNSNKDFDLDFHLVGTSGPPTNTSCATASGAIGDACNLGAAGGSFNTPGSQGVSCTGGNWGSNENSTFYTFTPTSASATLNVTGITCNDGTSGSAQFAVWTSCAAIGTYTNSSTFLGCVVGSSNLTMTGLTAGQTYYIVADGFAGDNCTWSFSGTNIVLPVELINFQARYDGSVVNLTWATSTEKNNAYFTIERSRDGQEFETVTTIKGANTSHSKINYSAVDKAPFGGTNYYRLKQTDNNGDFRYSAIDIINIKDDDVFKVVPNPAYNNADIIYSCFGNESATLSIVDYSGREIMNKTVECELGQNVASIDLTDQPKGIYFVVFTSGNQVFKAKLVKSE